MKVKEESEKVGLNSAFKNWKSWHLSHHFMANRWGNNGNSERLYTGDGGAPKSLQIATVTMKLKTLAPWKKSYDQFRQHIKKQRHYFANKGPFSQSYGFSSSCVWMWDLDYKESWVPKNWCFWTVVLEKVLSPLDFKEIKQVYPKRKLVLNIPWKDWCWTWNSSSLATWWEELTPWKRPWSWEILKAGGKGDYRGWDG